MRTPCSFDRRHLLKGAAWLGALLASGGASARVHPATATGVRPHLLIRNATLLTMDARLGTLSQGDVEVRDGQIIAVAAHHSAAGAQIIDARGMLLIPGLVDAHWHLWNSGLRNYAPTAERQPYFKAMAAVSQRFTPALSYLGVRIGLAQAAEAGITTVNNWAHNLRSPEHASAELNAMAESGLRGRFWYGYRQDLPADAPMDYADLERRLGQANGLLDFGLAARGPERTPAGIWQAEWTFARQHRLPISTHIGVTAQAQAKQGLQQLAQANGLGADVQLVHGTHLSDEDLRAVAGSGASLCLTPLTELRVGYGLAPLPRLLAAKVPLSLGIDTLTLAGNANPYQVMQATLGLATGLAEDEMALSPQQVLYWMTQGGADSLGLGGKVGSITPGKRADLVLIDSRRLGLLPLTDPAAAVVQAASPSDVDTVIADGRVIKRGGLLIGIDTRELAAEANKAWKHLAG